MKARYALRAHVRPQSRLSRCGKSVAGWLVLFVAVSLPDTADWLVTQDGTAIATEGPWKVKGRSLVFTALGGTLQTVHVDEIDLSMSEQLSENEVADRGLSQLRSGPSVAYRDVHFTTYQYDPVGVRVTDYVRSVPVAANAAAKCVPARIVGIRHLEVRHLEVPDEMNRSVPPGDAVPLGLIPKTRHPRRRKETDHEASWHRRAREIHRGL